MIVSVVIPTRNRVALLRRTLEFLQAQLVPEDVHMEVVVTDDGSTDETPRVVQTMQQRWAQLVYVQAPDRQGPGNPARARNAGLNAAHGSLVIFLDCGVVVPPDFVGTLARRYQAATEPVVLLPIVYGLFAVQAQADLQVVEGVTPATLDDLVETLRQCPEWRERRAGWYALVDDDLSQLPAPWSAAWTVALAAPKALVDAVGRFDDSFYGWGAEDIDLGYRLYQQGCKFVVVRDTYALHLPHPLGDAAEKFRQHLVNLNAMHAKYRTLATEVLPFYPGIFVNYFLHWLSGVPLAVMLPHYSAHDVEALNRAALVGRRRVLVTGVDDPVVAERLTASHHFVHTPAVARQFAERFPDRDIDLLLGVNVPYPDQHFDVVLCTDALRLYPPDLVAAMFRECHRIGKAVYLVWQPQHIPPLANVRWLSADGVEACLEQAGGQRDSVLELTTCRVDRIRWPSA
ncbi:MAG: glycosyltransferase [Firmicutes bacterium]|nr:glycosyltransferase [Bacillota bacterium]